MPQLLDQDFLESLLGKKISSYEISSGSKPGDNVAGSLKTISIRTSSNEDLTIIMKLLPTDPKMISYLVNGRLMECEAVFYGKVLGDMEKLFTDRNVKPNLPFAKYYGGDDRFVALEDLRPAGYRMADKYVGFNLQETRLVLKELARFHAATYMLIRENGEKMFKENGIMENMLDFNWAKRQIGDAFLKTEDMLTDVIDIMKEQREDLGRKLENLRPQFMDLFPGVWKKTDQLYFPVICHGDAWLNNVLLKYGDDNQPESVKFIDMQQVHRGNIFEDLNYFFFTSTTPEFRAKNLKASLEIYFESFVATLEELKCPIPIGFSMGFLVQHYFSNLKNIAVFVGGAIAFQLGNIPQQETGDTTIGLNTVTDNENIVLKHYKQEELEVPGERCYDDLGVYVRASLQGDARAVQRFVDVIDEFDKLGVFNPM